MKFGISFQTLAILLKSANNLLMYFWVWNRGQSIGGLNSKQINWIFFKIKIISKTQNGGCTDGNNDLDVIYTKFWFILNPEIIPENTLRKLKDTLYIYNKMCINKIQLYIFTAIFFVMLTGWNALPHNAVDESARFGA